MTPVQRARVPVPRVFQCSAMEAFRDESMPLHLVQARFVLDQLAPEARECVARLRAPSLEGMVLPHVQQRENGYRTGRLVGTSQAQGPATPAVLCPCPKSGRSQGQVVVAASRATTAISCGLPCAPSRWSWHPSKPCRKLWLPLQVYLRETEGPFAVSVDCAGTVGAAADTVSAAGRKSRIWGNCLLGAGGLCG